MLQGDKKRQKLCWDNYFYHKINNDYYANWFYPSLSVLLIILIEPSKLIKLILLKLRIIFLNGLKWYSFSIHFFSDDHVRDRCHHIQPWRIGDVPSLPYHITTRSWTLLTSPFSFLTQLPPKKCLMNTYLVPSSTLQLGHSTEQDAKISPLPQLTFRVQATQTANK